MRNRRLRDANRGCSSVVVVTGTESDQLFWATAFMGSRRDVFRQDGEVELLTITEESRQGNFLGVLAAWRKHRERASRDSLDPVVFMNMVVGKGKRLSPFTQSLGERKSAFPTPLYGERARRLLTSAEVASLYSNEIVDILRTAGFRGALVKWGDEIVIPDRDVTQDADFLRDCDAVRFTSRATITAERAAHKEWLAFEESSLILRAELSRQNVATLQERLQLLQLQDLVTGVNLGSLAASDVLLDAAASIFADVIDDLAVWSDWDPYVWIALLAHSREDWEKERIFERERGATGLAQLEARIPDFFERVSAVRGAVEVQRGRPLRVVTMDFGDPLWVDFGLHDALYQNFAKLHEASALGTQLRAVFGITEDRDENDNIIVGSTIAPGATVNRSLVLYSTIGNALSAIQDSCVIGTVAEIVLASSGAVCVESSARRLNLQGPNSVAFRCLGPSIDARAGERTTTILLNDIPAQFVWHESDGDPGNCYSEPIRNNKLSFEAVAEVVKRIPWSQYERMRQVLAQTMLSSDSAACNEVRSDDGRHQ